jgi:hypothetical protein
MVRVKHCVCYLDGYMHDESMTTISAALERDETMPSDALFIHVAMEGAIANLHVLANTSMTADRLARDAARSVARAARLAA